jgi:hypothetical protein
MAEQIDKRKVALLQWEMKNLQHLLDQFNPPSKGIRRAFVNDTLEFIVLQNMPLPDWAKPHDDCDLMILIPDFPATPPIGFYILETAGNRHVIERIQRVFNVLESGYHGAETIPGYQWICVHYIDNHWRYNANAPHSGDNLAKYLLGAFFGKLLEH